MLHGETTLPVWSYIVALISGAIVTPFSTLLVARVGNGIATNQLFKMIAGAINSGRPVANLYVSDLMFSSHALFFKLAYFFSVLHVESRCRCDFNRAGWRPQIRAVPQGIVVCFRNVGPDAHLVAERSLPVPCFYLSFGERLLVSSQINNDNVRGFTMVSVTRSFCEL